MTVDGMRTELMEAYPYPKWQEKVARMQEPQVIAIFKSMRRRNELYPHKKDPDRQNRTHQITIWEWMNSNEYRNGANQERETVF